MFWREFMEDTLKVINTLRSAHDNFSEKDVPDHVMKEIIDASMKAANASNVQRYSMILLDDPNVIFKVTGKKTAKKAIVYCLDYNRIMQTAEYMNYDYEPGIDNWYDIISGLFDVSALAQTAVIASAALGVDTLITNGVLRQSQESVKKQLRLPEKYCIAIMTVLFGYTEKPRAVIKNRLSQEYIVHRNVYGSFKKTDFENMINEYDEIYPEYIDAEHPHYLDYFYKEWCKPLDDNLKLELVKRMEEAGFIIP
jgi:nitroreductase